MYGHWNIVVGSICFMSMTIYVLVDIPAELKKNKYELSYDVRQKTHNE
jgi:hypothetical protein